MKLKYKLAIGCILLMESGMMAISLFTYHFIERTRKDELITKGVLLAQSFAARRAGSIERRNESELLKSLLDLTKDPEIVYGAVLSPDGTVIAHTEIRLAGQPYQISGAPLKSPTANAQVQQVEWNGQEVIEISANAHGNVDAEEAFFLDQAAPDAAQSVGSVRIGMSMKPMLKFLDAIRRGTLLILFIMLGVTFLASLVFAVFLTQPLHKLLRAIHEIGRGNLGYRINVRSNDEIGEMGEAFNRMAQALRESQTKALNSERLAAIGQLAAGVGHELKNPLGSINNALYYLKESLEQARGLKDETTVQEMFHIAETELKSSVHIINDLLDYSKAYQIEKRPCDLNNLLRGTFKSLKPPPGVSIETDFGNGLPPVEADRQRISQVFFHLITNAFHAMPKGGKVRIATRSEGAFVAAVCSDTGTGIRKEDLEKIFEPLFTTKAKGTGLGLAISKSIIEKHGGQIQVESEVGRGSTFTVKLVATDPIPVVPGHEQ